MRSSNKGTSINKAIDKFLETEKNKTKESGSTSFATIMDTHGGSSTGTFVTKRTFVKTVEKELVQESDLNDYEDWITFKNVRGWTEYKI